ncbi:hypothetical protein G6F42_019673 [Rhizopus arrhizus]|nr:hypothetical protein G6F42_019673 [Rhizopus arrhizus]
MMRYKNPPTGLEDGVQQENGLTLLVLLPSKEKKLIDRAVTGSVRSLHVLKEKYIGNVVKFIVKQLPVYQQTIQSFENDRYSVIGYARKTKPKESDGTRSSLLNTMRENLKMRSMVDKVFVSFKTSSNDPIMNMNMANGSKLLEKLDADGNTQEKIVVDSLPHINNEMVMFDTTSNMPPSTKAQWLRQAMLQQQHYRECSHCLQVGSPLSTTFTWGGHRSTIDYMYCCCVINWVTKPIFCNLSQRIPTLLS